MAHKIVRGLKEAVAHARMSNLEATLKEILRVAETSKIPDRHGELHQACDTTCLNECATLARKALKAKPERPLR